MLKGSTLWKLCMQNHKKTIKKTRDYLESAKKHNYGTIVERYMEDGQYQMHMHEQGYTQSDMEEFDRVAHENRFHVTSSDERAYCRDQS